MAEITSFEDDPMKVRERAVVTDQPYQFPAASVTALELVCAKDLIVGALSANRKRARQWRLLSYISAMLPRFLMDAVARLTFLNCGLDVRWLRDA
jgi:hypothetical protein